jgi:hypothetical protein
MKIQLDPDVKQAILDIRDAARAIAKAIEEADAPVAPVAPPISIYTPARPAGVPDSWVYDPVGQRWVAP